VIAACDADLVKAQSAARRFKLPHAVGRSTSCRRSA
jgi:hypothetical protein